MGRQADTRRPSIQWIPSGLALLFVFTIIGPMPVAAHGIPVQGTEDVHDALVQYGVNWTVRPSSLGDRVYDADATPRNAPAVLPYSAYRIHADVAWFEGVLVQDRDEAGDPSTGGEPQPVFNTGLRLHRLAFDPPLSVNGTAYTIIDLGLVDWDAPVVERTRHPRLSSYDRVVVTANASVPLPDGDGISPPVNESARPTSGTDGDLRLRVRLTLSELGESHPAFGDLASATARIRLDVYPDEALTDPHGTAGPGSEERTEDEAGTEGANDTAGSDGASDEGTNGSSNEGTNGASNGGSGTAAPIVTLTTFFDHGGTHRARLMIPDPVHDARGVLIESDAAYAFARTASHAYPPERAAATAWAEPDPSDRPVDAEVTVRGPAGYPDLVANESRTITGPVHVTTSAPYRLTGADTGPGLGFGFHLGFAYDQNALDGDVHADHGHDHGADASEDPKDTETTPAPGAFPFVVAVVLSVILRRQSSRSPGGPGED